MKRGSALLLALVVLFVVAATGLALFGQAGSGARQARRLVLANRAYYLAESGLHEGLDRVWRGAVPPERELAITDLDPPNRVSVRFLKSAGGALDGLEATGVVQDVQVTLRARVRLDGMHMFTRGRP